MKKNSENKKHSERRLENCTTGCKKADVLPNVRNQSLSPCAQPVWYKDTIGVDDGICITEQVANGELRSRVV